MQIDPASSVLSAGTASIFAKPTGGARLRALLPLLLLCGCNLLSLGRFDQTPPPRAKLSVTFEAGANNGTQARLTVLDAAGRALNPTITSIGQTISPDAIPLGTQVVLDFGTQDFTNLQLFVAAGNLSLKGTIPQIKRPAPNEDTVTEGGIINVSTTAAAQLITRRVQDDGGGYAGTPSDTIAALVLKAQDPGLVAVQDFQALVAELLAATNAQTPGVSPFDAASSSLSQAFLDSAALDITVDEYNAALALASEAIRIPLVCDTSLISVLFTVDISGKALDGNGKPQFIRQAPKEGKVFLAISVEPSSPVPDAAGVLAPQLIPNDTKTVMTDDGSNGDEIANDGVFSRLLVLPRGMRVLYKYTDGAAGEGFTRTEEWPGNARILVIEDTLTKNGDGSQDCLVIRRDSFGDEATNKNFVNLNKFFVGSGTLSFDTDTGGDNATAGAGGFTVGGLDVGDIRLRASLTPSGIPESRENGICKTTCPPPVVAPANDEIAPVLTAAEWIGDQELVATFSEAVDVASATNPSHWLLLDDLAQAIRIESIGAAGAKVTLRTTPADFTRLYTLRVQQVTDSSASQNSVNDDDIADVVQVGEDATAPKVSALVTQSLKDVNPNAALVDPTIGHVLRIDFNEAIDEASAQNTANYSLISENGAVLPVNAAILASNQRAVQLITAAQAKGLGYKLRINGVKDISDNTLQQNAAQSISFQGFALFRMTFGVVVDFAFANASGSQRGIPFGEKLFLTGNPLAVARDLEANTIALGGRTDVTGVPEFEMSPTADLIDGAPVFRVSVLVPPGVYAWKAGHGLIGEFLNPPVTLEKVHKNLTTTNDATGVTIDPRTLLAANGIDYTGAALSLNGSEPESPITLFKRENPDEVCTVTDQNTTCPTILVGTWRDIIDSDYDDGQRELDPIRPEVPDSKAPKVLVAIVRDSESVLLSFDESLGGGSTDLVFTLKDSTTGVAIAAHVEAYGGPLLAAHQAVLRTDNDVPMVDSAVYSIRFSGQKDIVGNRAAVTAEVQVVAPTELTPFTPLIDTAAPQVLTVDTPSPTEVVVNFNERVDAATATQINAYQIEESASGADLLITAATLSANGRKVTLTTAPQLIEEPYDLTVVGISDIIGNTLASQDISFFGFGDRIAPEIIRVQALSQNKLLIQFDEALDPSTASDKTNYAIPGVTVQLAEYSGDPALRASAFSGNNAPQVNDLVVLTTTNMTASQTLGLQVVGVRDTSGNEAVTGASFTAVGAAKKVTVVLQYVISSTTPVNGQIPSRAISLNKLATEREGVFLRGNEVTDNGATSVASAVTTAMGGFPAEGQPLTGAEPTLLDDGQNFDATAGDGVFTIAIPNVPLGSTLVWKGFASFSTAYRDANPGDLFAAFADATPGPSVFSDGQEFPGNDNAARIVGDDDNDGVVIVRCLFGDEASFKRFTGTPAFIWVDEEFGFQ